MLEQACLASCIFSANDTAGAVQENGPGGLRAVLQVLCTEHLPAHAGPYSATHLQWELRTAAGVTVNSSVLPMQSLLANGNAGVNAPSESPAAPLVVRAHHSAAAGMHNIQFTAMAPQTVGRAQRLRLWLSVTDALGRSSVPARGAWIAVQPASTLTQSDVWLPVPSVASLSRFDLLWLRGITGQHASNLDPHKPQNESWAMSKRAAAHGTGGAVLLTSTATEPKPPPMRSDLELSLTAPARPGWQPRFSCIARTALYLAASPEGSPLPACAVIEQVYSECAPSAAAATTLLVRCNASAQHLTSGPEYAVLALEGQLGEVLIVAAHVADLDVPPPVMVPGTGLWLARIPAAPQGLGRPPRAQLGNAQASLNTTPAEVMLNATALNSTAPRASELDFAPMQNASQAAAESSGGLDVNISAALNVSTPLNSTEPELPDAANRTATTTGNVTAAARLMAQLQSQVNEDTWQSAILRELLTEIAANASSMTRAHDLNRRQHTAELIDGTLRAAWWTPLDVQSGMQGPGAATLTVLYANGSTVLQPMKVLCTSASDVVALALFGSVADIRLCAGLASGITAHHGSQLYATLHARNGAGLPLFLRSSSILVDDQPPSAPRVMDGPGPGDADCWMLPGAPGETVQLEASWTVDTVESPGSVTYAWAVGSALGGADVVPWREVDRAASARASVDVAWKSGSAGQVSPGQVLYSSVRATDAPGNSVIAHSDGVRLLCNPHLFEECLERPEEVLRCASV